MVQTSAPNVLFVNTTRASFPLTDPTELVPVISEFVASQLLGVLLPPVIAGATGGKGMIFIDEMEEVISLGYRGSLRSVIWVAMVAH